MCKDCTALRHENGALRARLNEIKVELGQRVVDGDLVKVSRRWKLPPAQARTLILLFRANGRPIRTTLLINNVVGNESDGKNVVQIYISNLRKKLGLGIIETVHNVGYRLTEEGIALLETAIVPDPGLPPPEVDRFMGANDEPVAMGLAVAMTVGRLAHMKGPEYARDVFANVMTALDRQYGPGAP